MVAVDQSAHCRAYFHHLGVGGLVDVDLRLDKNGHAQHTRSCKREVRTNAATTESEERLNTCELSTGTPLPSHPPLECGRIKKECADDPWGSGERRACWLMMSAHNDTVVGPRSGEVELVERRAELLARGGRCPHTLLPAALEKGRRKGRHRHCLVTWWDRSVRLVRKRNREGVSLSGSHRQQSAYDMCPTHTQGKHDWQRPAVLETLASRFETLSIWKLTDSRDRLARAREARFSVTRLLRV